jgi:hypothetical protein
MENMQSTEIQYVGGGGAEVLCINRGGKYFCDWALMGCINTLIFVLIFFVLKIVSVFEYLTQKWQCGKN